jgi:ribosomal protein S18 acetylase RimI-like enzyme
MENVRIEYLSPADTQEAVNVLVRAFSIYFEAEKAWIKPIENERRLKVLFGLMLNHFHGIVFVAKKENRIVGVMRIVEWPLCQMSFLERVRYVLTLSLNMRTSVFKYLKLRSEWYKRDPKEPHWHLVPIGVVPELQGHGIGSQLMNRFCEHVDGEKKGAYLETDRKENVRLYERFGFSIKEEIVVDGQRNWLMWRPPRHDM